MPGGCVSSTSLCVLCFPTAVHTCSLQGSHTHGLPAMGWGTASVSLATSHPLSLAGTSLMLTSCHQRTLRTLLTKTWMWRASPSTRSVRAGPLAGGCVGVLTWACLSCYGPHIPGWCRGGTSHLMWLLCPMGWEQVHLHIHRGVGGAVRGLVSQLTRCVLCGRSREAARLGLGQAPEPSQVREHSGLTWCARGPRLAGCGPHALACLA